MKIQINKDLRLMRLWRQIADISWKNKLWTGWGIILIVVTIIFLIILPTQADFHTPIDIDTISIPGDDNALSILDENNHITILGSNRTIQQQILVNRLNNTEIDISDIEFLPNNLLAVADLAHDCIWVVKQHNISEIIWTWNAHLIDDINWRAIGLSRYWSNETLAKAQSLVDQPSNSFGIRDITFSPRSLRSRSFDSFIITLEQMDMVIEVSFTEEKSVIWTYGPTRSQVLKSPQSCKIMSTGNLLIADTGNYRCIGVNYNTRGMNWFYKSQFPKGDLLILSDVIEIQPLQIAFIYRSSPVIDILDYSEKSKIAEIHGTLLTNPIDIVESNGTIFIVDILQNIILEYTFESNVITLYWGSFYVRGYFLFLIGTIIIIHIGLTGIQIMNIKRKKVRQQEGFLIIGGYLTLICMSGALIYFLPYVFTWIGGLLSFR